MIGRERPGVDDQKGGLQNPWEIELLDFLIRQILFVTTHPLWHHVVPIFNVGSFNDGLDFPGQPRNLRYGGLS
jgi:hypothetical protein